MNPLQLAGVAATVTLALLAAVFFGAARVLLEWLANAEDLIEHAADSLDNGNQLSNAAALELRAWRRKSPRKIRRGFDGFVL